MSTPNTTCDFCGTPIYRKPWQLTKNRPFFCSKEHSAKSRITLLKECMVCKKEFLGATQKSKTCSKSCSNKLRIGKKYVKQGWAEAFYSKEASRNKALRRLELLQNTFNFSSCMIEGCNYNITYDIHRYVPGKEGGEYKIGNMFAICPNHHAEITRKIIKVEKINDSTLKIIMEPDWHGRRT